MKVSAMRTYPRVSAAAASGVVGLIGQCGGDAGRILHAARLDPHDIEHPGSSLRLVNYCSLFEQAARQTGVGSFGLRFGAQYHAEQMGAFGALVLNSPTLGQALRNLCAYFPAMQEHSTLALRQEGGLVALEYQIADGRITHRRQDAELSIGIFNNIFRRALGAGWSPEEVHFEHLRAADAGEVAALLNAPVYYAAPRNAILFRPAALDAPMPGAAPQRLPHLRAELRQRVAAAAPGDFTGRVASAIRDGFADGDASIACVAERLGFSRAGLYRRLAAEGVDFSALTQRMRREMAEMYAAQSGIAFTDVALLLGYSELSAFSRAFTRWTGLSPVRYRAACRH
jgi:AraC-like DNA-binding protein